jgi:signal transduction histidine kinase
MTDRKSSLKRNARTKLSARYLTALRSHLGKKSLGNGTHAQALGRAAVGAGLATVDLAIMHERAVVSLAKAHNFSVTRRGWFKRNELFLTNALIPLETAEHAKWETISRLHHRNDVLTRGNRELEREIAKRKAGEVLIRKGQDEYRALFLESQVMQKKLRQLTHQIITAQEEERKEISRELHDEVVQTLVGINVELAALGKGASVGMRTLKAKIARTRRLVENSVNAVHRFARELRPAVLDDLGLIPALHAYSKSLAARKKINIQMTAFGGVEALGGAKRTVLFRVAQEALTNVARHAHATQVKMSISEISGAIRMEINDNGRSFHVEKTLLARSNNRLGLVGMKERVEMVGGSLTIKSARGIGTTVRAEIPFTTGKTKT